MHRISFLFAALQVKKGIATYLGLVPGGVPMVLVLLAFPL
jgi:hypothetical protein